GMVTLVQQHQQAVPEGNLYQKEQEEPNCTIAIQSHDTENHRHSDEIVQSLNNTAVVVSANDSIASSCTQCSDVEDDDEEEATDAEEGDWIPDLPLPAVLQQHQQVSTADGNVVLPNADTSSFGDVRVKNSSNVHLGNKTFYKGPVTIKQFVYTNPVSVQENESVRSDDSRVSNADASKASVKLTLFQKVLTWLWSWKCATFLCVLALIVVIAVAIASVQIVSNITTPTEPLFPQIPDSGQNGTIVKNVRFIERNEWGAQPPSEPLTKMKLPVPYVIISHTATEICSTQSECTLHVRFAQTFHIESRGWSDIAYNFLVGGDGYVYVGRSWDYMGAHAFGFNNISIGISFIGTFNTVIPRESQLFVAKRLIELGVDKGKIASDYKLLGHRQISRTLSPGDALYKVIQTWPHWTEMP
ncbi:Peptidoglycan-recognition protein LE, partial [Dufourea novaeangliae]